MPREITPERIQHAIALTEKIEQLLSEHDSDVQAVVLVELVALWAYVHQPLDLRRQLLATHYAAVLVTLENIEAAEQKPIH
jgi:hypothetical protein